MEDVTGSDISGVLSNIDTSATDGQDPESVKFDNVRRAILGPSVKYQALQLLMCCFFDLQVASALYNFVFTGYEPPHVCAETNETDLLSKFSLLNITSAKVVYETCQIRLTSNQTGFPEDLVSTECASGNSYVGGKDVSIKTEWDLVCEITGRAELVQTLFNVGMLIATLVISPLADRFGRKPVIVACSFITTVLEFCMSFSPSIHIIIGIRLFTGIAIQSIGYTSFTLGTELLITKHREIYAMVMLFNWAGSLLTLGLVSYALRSYSWRVLQITSSLTGVMPVVFAYFFLNESLPWLLSKGRHSQALKIVQLACKQNGANFANAEHEYDKCRQSLKKQENKNSIDPAKSEVAKYGMSDLFRNRRLFIRTLILCLAMFTHNMTYSGLYLTSATFHVNRFFTFMIMCGLEFPASAVFFVLLSYLGRRTIILIFLTLTASCLLVSACLVGLGSPSSEHVSNTSTAFFLLGKFCIDISYNCFYSFLGEHFPTTIRSTGIGLCGLFSRIGGMVSPFLYPLFLVANWAPGICLATLGFSTVCFYLFVPETKGTELPTTVEDLSRKKKSTKQRVSKSETVV